jgi:hypothetical protein
MRTFCLAIRICRFRSAVAFGVQIGALGASAIMCFVPRCKTQVKVLVILLPHERHSGYDAEDVPLEGKPRLRNTRRARQTHEMSDRSWTHAQQARPILQRLHSPALNTAHDG